jgi:amino acid adenylation domain-containing protein/non-ribosomal peptide synthase protein (TIGR01720 family)
MVNNLDIENKLVKDYWKGKLFNYESSQNHPDYPSQFNSVYFEIDSAISKGIKELALNNELAEYIIYLSFLAILLYRYHDKPEMLISTAGIPNETDAIDSITLLFFKLTVIDNLKLKEVFRDTAKEVQESFSYAHVDFEELKSTLNKSKINIYELYRVGFSGDTVNCNSSEFEKINLQFRLEKDQNDSRRIKITYNTSLFTYEDIKRQGAHYINLLSSVKEHIDSSVIDLKLLSQSEERLILNDFNKTVTNYPSNKTIQELFEEQVSKTPMAIAVVVEDKVMTYEELNAQSNKLAHHLRENYTIHPNDFIGLIVNRSSEMIVSILGILKAGAAYVPIDASYPGERIKQLLVDSQVKLVITEHEQITRLSDYYPAALVVLDIKQAGLSDKIENPDIVNKSTDLAYLIYTSGSTGMPKGVMIEHKSIVRLVKNTNYINFKTGQKLLQTGSISFDAMTFEVWGMLLNGGELHLLSNQELLEVSILRKKLFEDKIDMMWFTSSWFNQLVDSDIQIFSKLNCILVGGEQLSPKHINKVRETYPALTIINGYGPTENTTFSTTFSIEYSLERAIPIGKPISHSTAYILNRQQQLVPVGVAGEIYLGGDGLARGYWQREDLTAEKFIAHPFSSEPGARLYRTGDLGRWTASGDIEFLGRIDSQVKIRGHRIELGEVENILLQSGLLDQVLVTVHQDASSDKQLIAYYTGTHSDAAELRNYMEQRVPAYMVPVYFISVTEFPLNSNGKVDKKRLPAVTDQGQCISSYQAPRTPLQQELVTIWESVLGKNQIGITDNFFNTGGDSIKAIRLVSTIRKKLEKEVEVKDIFKNQDIESLSNYITSQPVWSESEAAAGYERSLRELELQKAAIMADSRLSEQLPADWEDFFPMSDIQKGMLYYSQLHEGSAVYHDQIYYQVKDAGFKPELFKESFSYLVHRHALLRTSFYLSEFPEPLQVVHRYTEEMLDIEFVDLRHLQTGDQKEYLLNYLDQDRTRGFSTHQKGLWRLRVFRLSEAEYGILFIVHHSIIDGWSEASLRTELSNVYYSLKEGAAYKQPKLKATYKDYIIDQQRFKNSTELNEYWINILKEYTRTPLPFNKTLKIENLNQDKDHIVFQLEDDLIEKLIHLSEQAKVNLKCVFLTALSYLIKMTTNSSDLTLGLLSHGRPEIEDGDRILGCFLNTVPLRINIEGNRNANSAIRQVNDLMNEVKSFEKISLPGLLKIIGEESSDQNPLFDILYGFFDFHIYNESHEKATSQRSLIGGFGNTNTFFDLFILKRDKQFTVIINSLKGVYDKEELDKIGKYYNELLKCFAYEKDLAIIPEKIMGQLEVNKLLNDLNDTKTSYQAQKTIQELIEERVKIEPEAIAILNGENKFTYSEINSKANRLAHLLREKFGIKPNEPVGLILNRSENMVIGILGILKAGAAYVPIDAEYPEDRIQYILKDSGVKFILTERSIDHYINKNECQITSFCLDTWEEIGEQYSDKNPVYLNKPTDLSYIIYTSGSTGQPKGVEITHKNTVAFINWCTNEFSNSDYSIVYAGTSYCFDLSVFEILFTLTTGKCIRILKSGMNSIDYLNTDSKILLNTVPSVIEALIKEEADFKNVTVINMAGEPIPYFIKDALDYNKIEVRNLYGPTEYTTYSTCYRFSNEHTIIPAGKPIFNTQIYIVDQDTNLLPENVIGEICLSGDGLAHGYINNDELTKEKFILNPFKKNSKLYRTGDLGRWLKDGNIEFSGRKDSQIKIRGYRIELGEIENSLLNYTKIENAAAVVREDKYGTKQLVAYYKSSENINDTELKDFLKKYLPGYMMPAFLLPLSEFPLNANGKIDRNKLPGIQESDYQITSVYVDPRNEIEHILVSIWQQVLGSRQVGIRDNFFIMGGDSIKALQVSSRLYRAGYKIDVKDIFQHPSIEELSLYVKRSGRIANQSAISGEVPLTAIQKDFFASLRNKKEYYNQAVMFYSADGFDEEFIRKVFSKLQDHHDALRMSYTITPDHIRQISHDLNYPLSLSIFDLRGSEEEIRRVSELASDIQASIELSTGPLMKLGLFRLSDGDRLLVAIHHLVVDGVSWRILFEDIETLTNQYKKGEELILPLKTDSFKDWSEAVAEYAGSNEFLREKNYWINQAKQNPKLLERDFETGERYLKNKASVIFQLSILETNTLLTQVNQAFNTEINDILLTGLSLAINTAFEIDKCLIALEGHGREEIIDNIDVSRTVGWFTTVYPVLLDLSDVHTLGNQIKTIKNYLHRVPNKGIGYCILKYLSKKEDTSDLTFLPEPNISFNYLGQIDSDVQNKSFTLAEASVGHSMSPDDQSSYDLEISGIITEGILQMVISYNKTQFRQSTIEKLSDAYKQSLLKIINYCSSQKQPEPTSSDFIYNELSVNDLETFFD